MSVLVRASPCPSVFPALRGSHGNSSNLFPSNLSAAFHPIQQRYTPFGVRSRPAPDNLCNLCNLWMSSPS